VLCGCAHGIAVECGWRACVERSAQASTREPADAHLQGEAASDPALLNGKRVDFHALDTSGSVGCDVTIVDPTCPSYLGKPESVLLREAEHSDVQTLRQTHHAEPSYRQRCRVGTLPGYRPRIVPC
jgi:hypothetical protein